MAPVGIGYGSSYYDAITYDSQLMNHRFKLSDEPRTGLLTGIKGPHKIQRLTNAFFEKAGCTLNDMDCMR